MHGGHAHATKCDTRCLGSLTGHAGQGLSMTKFKAGAVIDEDAAHVVHVMGLASAAGLA